MHAGRVPSRRYFLCRHVLWHWEQIIAIATSGKPSLYFEPTHSFICCFDYYVGSLKKLDC